MPIKRISDVATRIRVAAGLARRWETAAVGLLVPPIGRMARIDRVDQIPHAVRSAFRAMTTGRPGAAHIALPYDLQKHDIDPAEV